MEAPTSPLYVFIWEWLNKHDLPNWIIFAFTAIVWPLVIYYWSKRKVKNIRNLEVSLAKASITINGNRYDAVDINFVNNTGSVVYINRPKITRCSKQFSVPVAATRDIAENAYDLLFMDSNGDYVLREITLHTNKKTKTSIAVTQELPEQFYQFKPQWYRSVIRRGKYFVLEYTAMVGDKKYVVSTVY